MKSDMSTRGLVPGVVRTLGDLVQYGEGSVVSRILLKAEGGNVTLFAFDDGQDLSEHTTKYDALAHVVEGSALIMIGGQENVVEAGQSLLLPANIPHAVKASERFKMVLTMLR